MPLIEKKSSGRGLTKKIYEIVIQLQVAFEYVKTQTEKNTNDIKDLNENQHKFITKADCEKCRQSSDAKAKDEESKKENQYGRRMSDKIAWRALKAVIIFNCLSITITIVLFILNYFK